MEKNIEVSLLLDFYGELLKPGVRETIDLYYNDDLSLAEVADQCGITRQGVHEIEGTARQIVARSTDTETRALAAQIAEKAGSLKE